MSLYEFLLDQCEDMPAWLRSFAPGGSFPCRDFFESRIVYYPGSGTDGHPVKVFGSTHSAHTFVYTDYLVDQSQLKNELETRGFRGYHSLARLELNEADVVPGRWIAHVEPHDVERRNAFTPVPPFGFLEVLERDHELGDNHGAERLAILFLGADGIAAFDALFCQHPCDSRPFVVVLQDHGFGCNYDRFGHGGLLEGLAQRCNVIPRWLFVAEDTEAWAGYRQVPHVGGDAGGMHNVVRFLYER